MNNYSKHLRQAIKRLIEYGIDLECREPLKSTYDPEQDLDKLTDSEIKLQMLKYRMKYLCFLRNIPINQVIERYKLSEDAFEKIPLEAQIDIYNNVVRDLSSGTMRRDRWIVESDEDIASYLRIKSIKEIRDLKPDPWSRFV